jgi:5'-phosphate synthase pdxT subunit
MWLRTLWICAVGIGLVVFGEGNPDERPLRTVFVSASYLDKYEVLADYDKAPVLVRQKNLLASSFHPELTGDTRIHEYFLKMISK